MLTIKDFEHFLNTNVPMIEYSGMSIIELNEKNSIVKMPFLAQNMNHVHSMYLGSLIIGAEVSGGGLAFYHINHKNINSTVVFKDLKANFIRRAESDIYFICADSQIITDNIAIAVQKKERVNFSVKVVATANMEKLDPVAEFEFTVSIKLLG